MMPSDELIGAKARLMRSAELALAISGLGGEESLEFEPRDYAEAIACLAAMPDDLSAVLAELDVLRGMFDESVRNFLSNGNSKEGTTDGNRKTKRRAKKKTETTPEPEQIDGSDGGVSASSDVGGSVSEEQPLSSGESSQDDDAPTDKRPRRRRSSRKRTPRSESGGDKGEGSED